MRTLPPEVQAVIDRLAAEIFNAFTAIETAVDSDNSLTPEATMWASKFLALRLVTAGWRKTAVDVSPKRLSI